jgi:hypothetical protein
MAEKQDKIEQLSEKIDRVLAAIGGLSDRMEVVEKHARQIPLVEERLSSIEIKLNGIARNLLSAAECAGLGITDAREDGVLPPDLTKAIKPKRPKAVT